MGRKVTPRLSGLPFRCIPSFHRLTCLLPAEEGSPVELGITFFRTPDGTWENSGKVPEGAFLPITYRIYGMFNLSNWGMLP